MANRKNTTRNAKKANVLANFLEKIEANRKLKYDIIMRPDQMRISFEFAGIITFRIADVDYGPFTFSALAHDQLAAFTGIPACYYNRLLAEAPELLVSHTNSWLRRMPDEQKLMIRTMNGKLSAILPFDFGRIDNEAVADVTLQSVYGNQGGGIVSADVTERRMTLVAVADKIHGSNHAGDKVQAGIRITNSETDEAGTTAQAILWRPNENSWEALAPCVHFPHSGKTAREDVADGLRLSVAEAFDRHLFKSRLASQLASENRVAA